MPSLRLPPFSPAIFLAAALAWSGWMVVSRQQARLPVEWRVLLPGALPELHPFLPADEAERQILDLLHEPLIRLDRQGRPAPALAEEWRWHLRVSCWFADAARAQAGRRALEAVPAETRLEWGLDEARIEGNALALRFAKPGTPGAGEALRLLAGHSPQGTTFWRVETWPEARDVMREFAAQPDHEVKRIWFDDNGACEIVTTLGQVAARAVLADWLRPRVPRLPETRALGEAAGLAEPVLEFRLSPARARWPDGAPVSADDVRATVKAALPLALPGREGLRHIQDIEAAGDGILRVIYRRNLGSVLAAWIGLPILPNASAGGTPAPHPMPHVGAGSWRVTRRDERSLLLERRDLENGALPQRLRFFPAQPASATRLTLAARGIDIIWPNESGISALLPWVEKRPLPSGGQLLLLWNARSPRAADPVLRAALNQMLDRTALAEKNHARVPGGFFPESMWFTLPARQTPPEPGPAERLRGLGWLPDLEGVWKKNGVPLEFTLLAPEDNASRLALAQTMALQWLDAGARVSIETLPQDSIIRERLATGRFDAVVLGRLNEPGYDASAWWHSRGALNHSGLADARLDLLLEALASEFDLTRVPARALAVEERLRELHIALPLLADAPHAAVSRARFAGRPGSTLRELLHPSAPAPANLKMLEPKE